MLPNIWKIVMGSVTVAHETLQIAYQSMLLALLGVGVIVAIGWLCNAYLDLQIVSLLLFFGVTILLGAPGFSPITLGVAAGLGVAAAELRDTDRTQGAYGATLFWCKVVLGSILGLWLTLLLLAVLPFSGNPSAFWYIVAAALVLGATAVLFAQKSGKTFVTIITVFMVALIAYALFTTLPERYKKATLSLLPDVPGITTLDCGSGYTCDSAPGGTTGSLKIDYRIYRTMSCLDMLAVDPAEEKFLAVSATSRGAALAVRHTDGVLYFWSTHPLGQSIDIKYKIREC